MGKIKPKFYDTPFRGKVKTLHLVSEPCDELINVEGETRQYLYLRGKGEIRFLGDSDIDCRTVRSESKCVSKVEEKRLMKAVAASFDKNHYSQLITYCGPRGNWELTLTNTKGETYRYKRELIADFHNQKTNLFVLSDKMRKLFLIANLYVFDGNSRHSRYSRLRDIRKVTVERRKPGWIKVFAAGDGVEPFTDSKTWIDREKLVLNLDRKTILVSRDSYLMGKLTKKYKFGNTEENFAEDFYAKFDTSDLFPDTGDDLSQDNPEETSRKRGLSYKIMIDYRNGPSRILKGRFDKVGLPTDFGIFMKAVREKLRGFSEASEIMNPDFYERPRYGEEEYIFCSVIFSKGGKKYYYLTDDETIDVDDTVLVPVGPENRAAPAVVVDIEYFMGEEAPYPIEKIKKIIRKCTEKDMKMEIGKDIFLATPEELE